MNMPDMAVESADIGFSPPFCGTGDPSSSENASAEVPGIPAVVSFRLSELPRWRPDIGLDYPTPVRDDE